MKFLITCLSIFFSISTVHAKKIYASIRNDMGQSIVVDLLGSKLPNGTGDVIATNTIAANATWTDSKLKIPDGFINVKARAKVTATGQVIETSWENISASKFYTKLISGDGSSGSGKEFLSTPS